MVINMIIFLSELWVDGISKVFSYILPGHSRSIDDEYQYLQQSSLPTMHFQASLPRLPIPKLEDTCKKYLKAQKAILSPEECERTAKNVAAFQLKEGPQLHQQLLELDAKNKHTSYISEPWFDMYLRDRRPLPINFNPYMVFYQEKNAAYNMPLVKATNILISSARFLRSLRAGLLEPEVFHMNRKKSDTKFFRFVTGLLPSRIATYGAYLFKAFPLDMSQFNHLFGTTRIPEIEKDRITSDPNARHVLVIRRGHLYTFDILNEDGSIRSPHEIASCVNTILHDPRAPSLCPIGILTTTERNQWARNRQHLVNLGNADVFKKIDTATFLLALDDDLVDEDINVLLRDFLHADGTNRWFDKSFTLIVTGKGWTAINFEHSWGDGVAVLRFCQDMKHDATVRPRFHPEERAQLSISSPDVQKLEFKIDDVTMESVNRALKEYKHWTDRLTMQHLLHNIFGKKQCKTAGVSPDAVMQLAFQLALYKLEKRAVATYESCSTAAFKHGRTETIRSCTDETQALCKAIVESGTSQINDSKYKKMMIECSNAHTALTKEAAMGQGFDRHLFMLRRICLENGGELPAIFKDPVFAKLNENILSTSTLGASVILGGGFGPVVEHGYGIGYAIDDTDLSIRLGVASYRDHRDASEYVASLKSAFEDIHRILQSE
ncbi:carnitine O-palmitoyltransferase 2, mitochondrial [Diachasma alloeum]|uniref:carnitine O-palmitoyltransferase 2, mitochondrial n=1 Tax=Diachasma alloeum TaxID=454923 RepID=UPI0007382619|nr:carnitine O-palmitoyltransferase 2, mitochondrial [Diachasma alloeum]